MIMIKVNLAKLSGRLVFVSMLVLTNPAGAEVKVDSAFGDHMVLQREMQVPVWGTGTPDEKVTVSFHGQAKAGTVDKAGKWMIRLDALKPGAPAELTVKGDNTITLQDVLVGEVWLGRGSEAYQTLGWAGLFLCVAAPAGHSVRHPRRGLGPGRVQH